ncbi:DUF4259 domain-containing protein [Lacrimispora sp.]|uniref:DUF4259 domain-containing protein n=1 Tax=Lacrimispora sp. TaxID=2719234 RepID=UPI0028A908FC|nr:DUF4259 domain-containing protein [Lacrimispora sp.]
MGCWGITAFESDAGLDSVEFIRKNIPGDGRLELGKIIEAMQKENYRVYDVTDGSSHSGPMALAEVIIKMNGWDFSDLDYDGGPYRKEKKFGDITSLSASRESLQWLRNYISDTLKYAKENAEFRAKYGEKWSGWFEESNWYGWQDHMVTLIGQLDTFLASSGDQMELLSPREREKAPINKQTF